MNDLVQLALQDLRNGAKGQKVAQTYGIASHSEAAALLANETPTLKQFMAQQAAEKRDFFRSRTSQGLKTQRATQQDHDAIIAYVFQSINDGEKPKVLSWLKTYGASNGRNAEWAKCVARHTHNKKMKVTLQGYQTHPVIQDLRHGNLFTQTHKGMLLRATYSGFAEMLYSSSQIVRNHKTMQSRNQELETLLVSAEFEITRTNALLEIGERWKGEAVAMHSEGISCRKIAEQLGKPKSTVHDYLRALNRAVLP